MSLRVRPLPLLLACLLGMLLFVRMVAPHWHQHLLMPSASPGAAPLLHLATAAAPHDVAHFDHDVALYGDLASAQSWPALPAICAHTLLLMSLLLLYAPLQYWPRRLRRPLARRRRSQLPPPLRGPPAPLR